MSFVLLQSMCLSTHPKLNYIIFHCCHPSRNIQALQTALSIHSGDINTPFKSSSLVLLAANVQKTNNHQKCTGKTMNMNGTTMSSSLRTVSYNIHRLLLHSEPFRTSSSPSLLVLLCLQSPKSLFLDTQP